MSGGRCPPFEDVKTDFRVPSAASAAAAAAAAATSNWLRTATYQIDNNATAAAGKQTCLLPLKTTVSAFTSSKSLI